MCSLTPPCDAHRGAWLRNGKHTKELDSAVWCTSQSLTPYTVESDSAVGCTPNSFFRNLVPLAGGGKHTVELVSAMGCTPRSSTLQWDAHRGVKLIRKCSFFAFSYLLRILTSFFRKTSEVKKIPWTIFDLHYQFHINIFRRHRENASVKLQIKTDTW